MFFGYVRRDAPSTSLKIWLGLSDDLVIALPLFRALCNAVRLDDRYLVGLKGYGTFVGYDAVLWAVVGVGKFRPME